MFYIHESSVFYDKTFDRLNKIIDITECPIKFYSEKRNPDFETEKNWHF